MITYKYLFFSLHFSFQQFTVNAGEQRNTTQLFLPPVPQSFKNNVVCIMFRYCLDHIKYFFLYNEYSNILYIFQTYFQKYFIFVAPFSLQFSRIDNIFLISRKHAWTNNIFIHSLLKIKKNLPKYDQYVYKIFKSKMCFDSIHGETLSTDVTEFIPSICKKSQELQCKTLKNNYTSIL